MGTSMDRMRGISIVVGDEMLATDEERGNEDRVGKSDLLGDRVCSENQRVACSVEKRQEVHPGMVMLDSRVAEDEGQEDSMVVEVREEELIVCDGCVCG